MTFENFWDCHLISHSGNGQGLDHESGKFYFKAKGKRQLVAHIGLHFMVILFCHGAQFCMSHGLWGSRTAT